MLLIQRNAVSGAYVPDWKIDSDAGLRSSYHRTPPPVPAVTACEMMSASWSENCR